MIVLARPLVINHPLEQLALSPRLFQLVALVEQALHQLLFLVAIGEDFADGLGDQPQGRIVALGGCGPGTRPCLPCRLSRGTRTCGAARRSGWQAQHRRQARPGS